MIAIFNNTDSHFITVDNKSSCIEIKSNISFKEGEDKWKLKYDSKLELHLRNSEVIGIPFLHRMWQPDFTLTSHNIYKPLMGTHYGLYFTIETKRGPLTSDLNWNEPIIFIKLISKNYWSALIKKQVDGLMSVPIEIKSSYEL